MDSLDDIKTLMDKLLDSIKSIKDQINPEADQQNFQNYKKLKDKISDLFSDHQIDAKMQCTVLTALFITALERLGSKERIKVLKHHENVLNVFIKACDTLD